MLDIKFIRENTEKMKKGVAAKQLDPALVDEVVRLYDVWSEKLKGWEELRQEKNKIAHESKGYSKEGKDVKEKLVNVELEVQKAHAEYQEAARNLPNPPADDVIIGKDETENEIVRKWGEPNKFDFKIKDHLELGESLDIIDVKHAAKVSGARFGYLKGDAVLLELALVNFALDTLSNEGFTPIVPPVLVKVPVFHDLGYSEHLGNENYYLVHGGNPGQTNGEEESEYYLVGTSEHSVVPYFKDETLSSVELPKRFVSFSTCFRREAGSYGKDTKGILRVHQFDKIEMVSFTKPEDSDKEHEYLLNLEEKLLQALKIPYQVVKMCSGDLGAPATRKFDLEAWIPSQNKYRELTSTSNCTDFQARRLNIKFRYRVPARIGEVPMGEAGGETKTGFVHILNGTAFAIGRTIIAILENYQNPDGSVTIPKILQKYLDKSSISAKVK